MRVNSLTCLTAATAVALLLTSARPQSCDGQGFDPVSPPPGDYSVTLASPNPDAEAIARAKKVIQEGMGMELPSCPECPVGQTGCSPGNYTTGGNITWSEAPDGGNTVVTGTVPAGMRIYKVCGLCAVTP